MHVFFGFICGIYTHTHTHISQEQVLFKTHVNFDEIKGLIHFKCWLYIHAHTLRKWFYYKCSKNVVI